MPIEIERKFLVTGEGWRELASPGRRFCQGYLTRTPRGKVRVRRSGSEAFLTVKGARVGISRSEYEYPIPLEEAEQMLRDLCLKPLLEKTRYDVPYGGLTWEVDVFHGAPDLERGGDVVLAEIELDRADQPVLLPPWVGVEVTHDRRYSSAALLARRTRPADSGPVYAIDTSIPAAGA